MPTLAELTPTFSTLDTDPNSWTLLEVDGVTGKISASDLRSALHADPIVLQDGAISLGSATGTKAYIAADGAGRFTSISVIGTSDASLTLQNTTATGYTQTVLTGTGRRYHLGVGNASETALGVANKFYLYDHSASAVRLVLTPSGAVGVGTVSPQAQLDVMGKTLVRNTTGDQADPALQVLGGRIFVGGDATGADYGIFGKDVAGLPNLFFDAHSVGSGIGFYTNDGTGNNAKLYITASGAIGVGTANPQTKLDVMGRSFIRNTSGNQFDAALQVFGGRIFVGGDATGADHGIIGKDTGGVPNLFFDAHTVGSGIAFYTDDGTGNSAKFSITAAGGGTFAGQLAVGASLSVGTSANVSTNLFVGAVSGGPYGAIQAKGTASVPAFFAQLSAVTDNVIMQSGINPTYGWKWMQDESANGDMFLRRRESSIDYDVAYFKRSNGNVGIETTSPQAMLHVAADARIGGFGYFDSNGSFGWNVAPTYLIDDVVPVGWKQEGCPISR